MKIGILGSGDVAKAITKGLADLDHQVMISSRQSNSKELQKWAKITGKNISTGSFNEAAKFGKVIFIAVLGVAVEDAINLTEKSSFSKKVVIDVTNPLDFSKGMPPRLFGKTSNGELVQKLLHNAYVVKTLNIVGHTNMVNPKFKEGEPDMLLCGNDKQAKDTVVTILYDFGWKNITDLGGIEQSRVMESFTILWVIYGIKNNNWNIAFKMLQK
jgi:predicted dinucleotide-binding enzyme